MCNESKGSMKEMKKGIEEQIHTCGYISCFDDVCVCTRLFLCNIYTAYPFNGPNIP